MHNFNVERKPYEERVLFYRKNVSIEPGLTVLVGCNGYGKSTFLRMLHNKLKQEKVPVVFYDNLHDGGSNSRARTFDMSFLATSICSSEGENIVMNMGNVAMQIGRAVREQSDSNERWLLLDAVDSGLSIDNVIDLKENLFDTMLKHNNGKDIYIVVSANEYEMCRGEKCFDTYLGKYIDFKDYEDYRKYILKSRSRCTDSHGEE